MGPSRTYDRFFPQIDSIRHALASAASRFGPRNRFLVLLEHSWSFRLACVERGPACNAWADEHYNALNANLVGFCSSEVKIAILFVERGGKERRR
jgi:hypothetical protein